MSVRKLADAALWGVKTLQKHLAEHRMTVLRGLAAAGVCLGTQGALTAGDGEHMPLRDPFHFDPDFRWFEPIYDADLEGMKPKKRANTGWFGALDRMVLWASRPENETAPWLLDRGRGDRFDLGYMLDNDHGYAMTYMNYRVRAFDGFNRERLNRYNEEQLDEDGPDPFGPPFGLPVPPEDGNNFGFNNRFVEVRDSENVADFHSLELNKTWRLEPYYYGGMLEPLVGVRYMRFVDTHQRMLYNSGLFPKPDDITEILAGEQVLTERSLASNDLVGGQFGFRYFKFVDRFRYSAELRVFSLANFQSNKLQTFEELTLYEDDSVDPGDEVQHYLLDQTTPIYGRSDEFAFGYDIRSEVSYTLSRAIELRGGFQMIDIARGIWRGRLIDAGARTDQRVIMAGLTFGVALNR